MRTEKQIEASRHNGAKSKGPVTPEGKAVSARNGITHGLSGSHKFLYRTEQDDLYLELLGNYMELFQPANGVERDLLEEMVTASWRMKRIDAIEASTVENAMDRHKETYKRSYAKFTPEQRQAMAHHTNMVCGGLPLWGRYRTQALRSYNSALKTLKELQRDRPKAEPVKPQPVRSEPKPAPPSQPAPETPSRPVAETPTRPAAEASKMQLPSEPGNWPLPAAPPLYQYRPLDPFSDPRHQIVE